MSIDMTDLFEYLSPDTLLTIIGDLYWNDGFDVALKMTYATRAVKALIINAGETDARTMLAEADIDITEFGYADLLGD